MTNAHDEKSIDQFRDRLRPAGILYVDVYPYRLGANGRLEVLALRRREDVVLPGQWQAVSGKLDPGERMRAAFARQVKDKTGHAPVRLFDLGIVNTYYDDHYDTVMLVPAAAALLRCDEIVLNPEVHVEHRWISVEEAERYFPWRKQVESVEAIERMARGDGALRGAQELRIE